MAGYSRAGNVIANMPQSQVIFYDKAFIKNLKLHAFFLRCMTRRSLPMHSGNQLELFMYQTLGPNTAQAAEGVVGASISISVVDNITTIGQLADYMNYSDLLLATAIDPTLENGQKELAYRLALSLNTIGMRTADSAILVDGSVTVKNGPTQVFTRPNITSAVASLEGRNVPAFDGGYYVGIIHPFAIGDALNDATYGGATDILKRTAEGQGKLSELPISEDGDNVPVLEWAGVRFHASTLVTQTPNFNGGTSTALRTYIFGADALISISLGDPDGVDAGDGDWRNLKLWMNKYSDPSVSDPARMIGGSTAYNTKWACTLPPDTTMRMRLIDAPTAIS